MSERMRDEELQAHWENVSERCSTGAARASLEPLEAELERLRASEAALAAINKALKT